MPEPLTDADVVARNLIRRACGYTTAAAHELMKSYNRAQRERVLAAYADGKQPAAIVADLLAALAANAGEAAETASVAANAPAVAPADDAEAARVAEIPVAGLTDPDNE